MTTICYNSLLTPALLPPSWVILGGKIAPTHESYLSPSFMQRQVLTKLTVTRLNRLFLYIIFLTTENKDQVFITCNASLIPSKSFLQVKMNGDTDNKKHNHRQEYKKRENSFLYPYACACVQTVSKVNCCICVFARLGSL